jgi:hypothetical protein
VYEEDAPSYFPIKFWFKQFGWGGESLHDDLRCGRPVKAKTNENFKKVEILLLAGWKIRVWMIADEVRISEATVLKILHEDLRMNEVSAPWISKLLNPEQKLCQ